MKELSCALLPLFRRFPPGRCSLSICAATASQRRMSCSSMRLLHGSDLSGSMAWRVLRLMCWDYSVS